MFLSLNTPIENLLVMDQVDISCVMTIQQFDTHADIIRLDLVDFHMILGIDQLSPYYAVLDCFSNTIPLAMPDTPPMVW